MRHSHVWNPTSRTAMDCHYWQSSSHYYWLAAMRDSKFHFEYLLSGYLSHGPFFAWPCRAELSHCTFSLSDCLAESTDLNYFFIFYFLFFDHAIPRLRQYSGTAHLCLSNNVCTMRLPVCTYSCFGYSTCIFVYLKFTKIRAPTNIT